MKISKLFGDIFAKDNLYVHISMFSLLGIMAIFSSNIADLYLDTLYFGFPPISSGEMLFDTLVSLFIFILFKGYLYDYARAIFENDDIPLPDVKIGSVVTFFKVFPLYVVWSVYFAIMIIIGMNIFKIINIWSDIYYALVWCLLPFVWVLILNYSRNFDNGTSIFNPLPLFAIIKKSFSAIVVFVLKTVPIILVIGLLMFKCFVHTKYLANYPSVQLCTRLFLLSLTAYFCYVAALLYVRGFVEIAKEKELI